jgi:uncharacterized alpha-E superfamily protein
MVAAPAPVIDLVVLDPNNPRSLAYQLARIEAHLAALPQRNDDGRLSPPEQIAPRWRRKSARPMPRRSMSRHSSLRKRL